MRLIDADEFRREMFRKCIETDEEVEKGRAKWKSGLWIRYKVFEDTIEQVPSVQPEPKHGKWIVIMNESNITFDECKCSECGVIEYFNKGWKKFSFCPNCGARMEESE